MYFSWANIDWAATGYWMQAWAGFTGAIAVVAAAKIGSARFGDWLRQQQMLRQLGAAERVLTVVYRLRRAFRAIRSPGQFGGELARAEDKLKDSYDGYAQLPEAKQRRLRTAQVVLDRINANQADWTEFFACLPVAKAYFGDDVEAELERLWKQQVAISVSAEMYGDAESQDERRTYEADFWEGFGGRRKEQDNVGREIEAAIAALEARLVPLLREEVQALRGRKAKEPGAT